MSRPPNDPRQPRLIPASSTSPCVQVCTLHPDGSHCVGCFRTVDEIAGWSTYTDTQREAVMGVLEERRAARRAELRARRPSRRRGA